MIEARLGQKKNQGSNFSSRETLDKKTRHQFGILLTHVIQFRDILCQQILLSMVKIFPQAVHYTKIAASVAWICQFFAEGKWCFFTQLLLKCLYPKGLRRNRVPPLQVPIQGYTICCGGYELWSSSNYSNRWFLANWNEDSSYPIVKMTHRW